MARHIIQHTVIGLGIDTPEPGATDIGKTGTELKPQQPEQPQDDLTAPGRIRHQLHRPQAGLVFEQSLQDKQRVA